MIRIFPDYESLSRAAAERFAHRAGLAAAAQDLFTVALSGSATPRRTYELLAEPPLRDRIPWEAVHVFWGDERCVPPDNPRSNVHLARTTFLDRVPLPPENLHKPSCTDFPHEAAQQYDAFIEAFFAPDPPTFDLIFLGLGEDGHTASLFPGSPALEETVRLVVEAHKPGESFGRITFTPGLINAADEVIFLVSGSGKARILREVLEGPHRPRQLPAQLIRAGGGPLWLLDEEAAELLQPVTAGAIP
ncbi:MAG: 6-phosphogluconolactonase [Candidatus Zixiibacteriota bacterium]|nr:MAG: 6-phosphogluconolactonase [candidate division Zixibacteria bacterium]